VSDAARAAYDRVAAELVDRDGATAGQMFGMPCLKVRGKVFAGFHHGAMVFKLGADDLAQALALPGASQFDPGMGRPMKQWAQVPGDHADRWGELGRRALGEVATTAGRR
jgi:hypothetical protein